MSIIYEPKGRAKEYAPLAVNLYSGCAHGCTYCFGPQTLKKRRQAFKNDVQAKKNALTRLQKDAAKLKGDDREILLSFVTDPYQPLEMELKVTRQAIETLIENDLRFTILTKGGTRAIRDFDLLEGYNKARFGSTLIFTSQKDADKWEPNAPSIVDRIEAINQAHAKGIETWVSLEPVIDPKQALKLIQELHPIVGHWKVGKLTYKDVGVNWIKSREDVKALFDSLGADYYLKKSLTELPEPRLESRSGPKGLTVTSQSHAGAKKAQPAKLPKTKQEMDTLIANIRQIIKLQLDEEEAHAFDEEFYPERELKESVEGHSNVLVVAPHGFPGNGLQGLDLAVIAVELHGLVAESHNCGIGPDKGKIQIGG